MDTVILSRLKALGGAEFLDQLIQLHNQRCQRRFADLAQACRELAWEQAHRQALLLRVEAEELGAGDLLPQTRAIEQLLDEYQAPAPDQLAHLLDGLLIALATMEQQLARHQQVA
jgi:hypothetical protein